MRYFLIAAIAATTLLIVAPSAQAANSAYGGEVVERRGHLLIVEGHGVARWTTGLRVWISQVDKNGQPGLVLAEALVRSVHQRRAVVVLQKATPNLPKKVLVEPRFVAESRQYRRTMRLSKPGTVTTVRRVERKPLLDRTFHKPPSKGEWGESLWLEVVGEANVRDVAVRWRLGRTGPFQTLPMKAAADGMWTANVPVGRTPPDIRIVQYYVSATVTGTDGKPERRVVVAHPSRPQRVSIHSAPHRPRGQKIDHDAPSRWTHKQPLVLTAQIDKRYRNPVVWYRHRGGGTYQALPMTSISPETWQAKIPARKVVVPGIAYWIGVTDNKGVRRDGFRNKRRPWTVHVTRGRILSEKERRNRMSLSFTRVSHGDKDDTYQEYDIGFERLFFGFLVARLGGNVINGRSPATDPDFKPDPDKPEVKPTYIGRDANLLGGYAGIEARIGDYFSAHADMQMAIHNDGGAVGYRGGLRIGDEAGANLTGEYGAVHDIDTAEQVLERMRFALSAPIGTSIRLAGVVVNEDVLQDSSKGLRLQVEGTWILHPRFFLVATVGSAGRDADSLGVLGGGGVHLVF